MTAVLGLAWAALVLAGAARWRPPPGRLRRPRPSRARPARRPGRAPGVVLVAAASLAAAAVALPLAPLPALAAWARPRRAARRAARQRRRRLEASLPEAVDLLALAVGAGCNVPQAVAAAGRRGSGLVAAELAAVTAGVARGERLADALDALPARAGEAVRPLAAALSGCERYGAPLVPTLERLADEVRRQAQRRAEEAARKVPVLMVFPLVVCILPAFALLTVAPLVASALGELRL